jgi:hypothetical protein
MVGKLSVNLGKNKQEISNGPVLGIVSDTLQDFLDNNPGNENVLSPV